MFYINDLVFKKRKSLIITPYNYKIYTIINVYAVNGLYYYKLSDNSIKRETDLILFKHYEINKNSDYNLFNYDKF